MHLRSAVSCVAAAIGTGASLMEADIRLLLPLQAAVFPTITKTRLMPGWSHDYIQPNPAQSLVLDTSHKQDDSPKNHDVFEDVFTWSQHCFSLSWNASSPLSISLVRATRNMSPVDLDQHATNDVNTQFSYIPMNPGPENEHALSTHFTIAKPGIVYVTDSSTSPSVRFFLQSPAETCYQAHTTFDAAQEPTNIPGPSVLRFKINLELQWQWQNFQVLDEQWLNKIGSAVELAGPTAASTSSSQPVVFAMTTTRTTTRNSNNSRAHDLGWKERIHLHIDMDGGLKNDNRTIVGDTISAQIDSAQALLFLQRNLALLYALYCGFWGLLGTSPKILHSVIISRVPDVKDISTWIGIAYSLGHLTLEFSSVFFGISAKRASFCEATLETCKLHSPFSQEGRPSRLSSLLDTLDRLAYDPRIKCSAHDTGLLLCLGSLLGISVLMCMLMMPDDSDD